MAILSVKHLSFGYAEKSVLKDINFSVQQGAVCGLLGPNGSGKTTLLKCINGLLKTQRGQVVVGGRAVGALTRRNIADLMAVVPQNTAAAFSFTSLQMVIMARAARLGVFGAPSRKDYFEAEKVIDNLGMAYLKDWGFNELSGGEKQMVLLARALFQTPRILLLDEPTAHLDFKNQYAVLDMVKAVTRTRNLTTIMTLHDPNLALRYCNQMVMLKQGTVHRKGAAADVFEVRALESLYGMKVSIENSDHGKCFVMPLAQEEISHPPRKLRSL